MTPIIKKYQADLAELKQVLAEKEMSEPVRIAIKNRIDEIEIILKFFNRNGS